ncbi:hypothetical protein LTR85_011641 [Meristemomyces frigidus]|nr:hypothetical protein LTR85_011641 [Meristemomyces frigidus]
MQFIFTILAALVATVAAADNAWSSTQSATPSIQAYCSGQVQPSGRYTYNSSNPFPISTYATVHNGSYATSTYMGNVSSSATVGPLSTGTGSISMSYNATFASSTSGSSSSASSLAASTVTYSAPTSPAATSAVSTGAASRHSMELMGALGGFGAFAVAAVLL